MPYADKHKLYAAQKRYRQRQKAKNEMLKAENELYRKNFADKVQSIRNEITELERQPRNQEEVRQKLREAQRILAEVEYNLGLYRDVTLKVSYQSKHEEAEKHE